MNILFLSDLHFGRELFVDECKEREIILESLIQTLIDMPQNMKPHYIVVTGDIAWTGSEIEYDSAYAWFSKLLSELGFEGERITFCVGNHDVNRRVAVGIPFTNIKKAKGFDLNEIDRVFQYENIDSYNVQIQAYNDFCCRLGVVPYEYTSTADLDSPYADKMGMSKQWYSYTTGYKDITFGAEKYRILAFNSAMLSGYDGMPDDENFIGLPQLQQMKENNIVGNSVDRYTVALFHHAERYLNTHEMNSYDSRPATFRLLMDNVNLALCGHTETGTIPVLQKQGNAGTVINGGAAYYSDRHPNSFSILRVDPNKAEVECKTFICCEGVWQSTKDETEHTWPSVDYQFTPSGKLPKDQKWKFRIYSDTESKEIQIRHMDYGLSIDGTEVHQYFTNRKDVNRLLDISGNECGARFKMAIGRERSVSAMFEKLDIAHFVDRQVKNGKTEVLYDVEAPDGQVVLRGPIPLCDFSEEDYRIYDFTKRARNLEETFGVRFSMPDKVTAQEQVMVQFLEDYLEDGGAIFSNTIDDKMVYFSGQKVLFSEVYHKIKNGEKEVVSFVYNVPMVCSLFGVKIKLGMCKVFVANLLPCDLEAVKSQADTFMVGDRRQLTMNFINGYQQIVFLSEDWEQKHPELQKIIEPLYKKSYLICVEPQVLSFGAGIFQPDKVRAKKMGIKLANTLLINREIYKTIWTHDKGMLI